MAGRDLTVARRNLAELTRYIDIHAAHLATCAGESDDNIPLMAALMAVKSGEKWGKWGKVVKSGEKLEKVGKSGKKWEKVGKSGK